MAGYEILFKESVYKDLRTVPKTDLQPILARIEQLGTDPRPQGGQQLTGAELYRVRQGNYRIVYTINTDFREGFNRQNNITPWTPAI